MPCHWPSRLFVSKFKIKRLYIVSHLFTSILHSLLESTRRMKNAKSLPLSLLISLLALQRPACKNAYKVVTHASPGNFFCCFSVTLVTEKKGSVSPGKIVKSHLFSWVRESAQLLQQKTENMKESIPASEETHFNPTASIPVTASVWVRYRVHGLCTSLPPEFIPTEPQAQTKIHTQLAWSGKHYRYNRATRVSEW